MSRPGDVQVNGGQEKALRYITKHRKITKREYQRLCGVSERQSLKDLTDLTEKGMLIRSGKGRATHYRLLAARLVRDSARDNARQHKSCAGHHSGRDPESRVARDSRSPIEAFGDKFHGNDVVCVDQRRGI